ncbi:M48 family metalloprotease [uncultured Prochlorococcus sp.]|uniref:M48 family metalloprotease n=1 Tax=uncultured Prochlorococcus sp. TaxID=159733 RepID=UPI0025859997|nr:M48 family metalloprotease [uncultured Prochlorococcus sp.]
MLKKIKNKYPYKLFTGIIVLSFSFLYLGNFLRENSTYFMPKEYKTIKKIVDKLASKNDLGDRDIRFSIGSGIYMQHRAEELGLCEKDGCFYYRNLDPYKNYKKVNGVNVNELLKQSYLFNGIEAYAWNDIVWLSKSSFLSYAREIDYLGCTIGHELSHIVFNDHIKQSIKLSENLKKLKDKNKNEILIESKKIKENDEEVKNEKDDIKEVLEKELSRESEMIADNNAAKMFINAGYDKETCLNEITFIAEKMHWEADTDIKSTHPGYLERFESLQNFIAKYDKSTELKDFEPYRWKWSFDRKLNILIFSPQK